MDYPCRGLKPCPWHGCQTVPDHFNSSARGSGLFIGLHRDLYSWAHATSPSLKNNKSKYRKILFGDGEMTRLVKVLAAKPRGIISSTLRKGRTSSLKLSSDGQYEDQAGPELTAVILSQCRDYRCEPPYPAPISYVRFGH